MSATSNKPGSTNLVDVQVELRNAGGAETRLVYVGTWLDKRGNFCGSNQSVIDLPANHTYKIETGTAAQRATRFRLAVNRTEATQDELLTMTLKDPDVTIADGYGFTYAETSTVDAIPNWTVRGQVDGEPFQAKTILFSPSASSEWTLQILDEPIDILKEIAIARQNYPALQVININLPREPKRGDLWQKKLSFGGGHFQVKTSPESKVTTSWNEDNAWVIEITDWETRSWTEGGGIFQQVGRASGRLYVAYKGSEHGIKNSWVSGTFEDAAIVYYGRPSTSP